jgi:hypothetical protein
MVTLEATETDSLIDDLLAEAEVKENDEALAYYDLVVREVARLEGEIAEITSNTDREVQIIKSWALDRNVKFFDRIEFLQLKLEAFIRAQDKKTIELPHGTLKLRAKPDKVEVTDLELFMKSATKDLVITKPEEIKPSLTNIKKWIKMTSKVPDGVAVIEGKTEFKLTLKEI